VFRVSGFGVRVYRCLSVSEAKPWRLGNAPTQLHVADLNRESQIVILACVSVIPSFGLSV
jgi:hypothetical protein